MPAATPDPLAATPITAPSAGRVAPRSCLSPYQRPAPTLHSRGSSRRRRAAAGQKTRPTKPPRRLSRTRAGNRPRARCPLDADTARRTDFASPGRTASSGRPAAATAAQPPRPAGPAADAGPHAAGPARRLALLQPYGNLSARSRARLQPADVLLWPPAGRKVPAGAPRRRTAGKAAAPGSSRWRRAARRGRSPGGTRGKAVGGVMARRHRFSWDDTTGK